MFRLMAKDLVPLPYYRKESVPSDDYIGTETQYVMQGYIDACVSPVTDNVRIALYGERVSSMYSLIIADDAMLRKGDMVEVNGVQCTVVGFLTYSDHVVATVEKVGKK